MLHNGNLKPLTAAQTIKIINAQVKWLVRKAGNDAACVLNIFNETFEVTSKVSGKWSGYLISEWKNGRARHHPVAVPTPFGDMCMAMESAIQEAAVNGHL